MSKLLELELENMPCQVLPPVYGDDEKKIYKKVDILIEAVLRLEKEKYDAELKVNTFNKILDEYDEVIGRLHILLKKYEKEGMKEIEVTEF